MASVATEDSSAGISFEGSSSGHQFQSGESLAEWRSSKQVENGTPSTSPPYWDSDDEDEGGPRPSDLYGKHTWKIEKFSESNKRELRSDPFDIGGYKWYILIYPQGCDVCNHLSLFLCVSNHDKLLPGWSHFAQFTIAVVNKDPKKSKYSDTLHRFCKKEHDWGWKKFMEIAKLYDGFVDADTLIIKAQVQVIRERADRPFRCLDILYRRELVRVYIANVEQIFRRFVDERRGKIVKLIEDKARWSSFRSFWGAMDLSSRQAMSREKTEAILKVVVKHFFIEKEVSSTLVMDALHSGLKSLESRTKAKKSKNKYIEGETFLVPIIRIEEDTFVLVDDVLSLLAIASTELLTAKDDKGHQNRTKDGVAKEDFNKDSFEGDERCLTELGRRTIEIFVLAHIFSKIEIAYQEAVALRKQEELIQEEAALLAGMEQKGKRGADKEKKSKKKQGKQKQSNRKAKDKGKDEKSSSLSQVTNEQSINPDEKKGILAPEPGMAIEKSDTMEDISDAHDSLECVPGKTAPSDSEDSDASEVPLSKEVSTVPNAIEGRNASVIDDSSSASSSDLFSQVSRRKPQNENSFPDKNQRSVSSGKDNQRNLASDSVDWFHVGRQRSSKAVHAVGKQVETYRKSQGVESLSQAAVSLSRDTIAQKEEKPASLPGKSLSISPTKSESKLSAANEVSAVKISSKDNSKQADRSQSPATLVQDTSKLRPDNTPKLAATPKPTEKPGEHRTQVAREKPPAQPLNVKTEKPLMSSSMPVLSRPSSAPVSTGPRPVAATVSIVQSTPVLARSVSVAGRLGPEPSVSSAQIYAPQSYRNAITGSRSNIGSISSYTQNQSTSSVVNGSLSYAQATSLASSPMIHPHSMDITNANKPMLPSFSIGMMNHHDVLQNKPLWSEPTQRYNTRNIPVHHPSVLSESYNFDLYNPSVMRPQHSFPSNILAGASGRQGHVLSEEFPHLDIINDLLNEEHGIGRLSVSDSKTQKSSSNGLHSVDLQIGFPDDVTSWRGPSKSPSRFNRTGSYQDASGLQHGYGASRSTFDGIHQVSPSQPSNGQTVGFLANQWQLNGLELPYNQMNVDTNGYAYNHVPEYQNLNIGTNGYNTVFRPTNGHK